MTQNLRPDSPPLLACLHTGVMMVPVPQRLARPAGNAHSPRKYSGALAL